MRELPQVELRGLRRRQGVQGAVLVLNGATRAELGRATDQAGQGWEAPCAVIAAGTGSGHFAGLDWLPLQAIRGQTTQLPSDDMFSQLQAVLCHEGYIAPAQSGSHCIGATFDLNNADP